MVQHKRSQNIFYSSHCVDISSEVWIRISKSLCTGQGSSDLETTVNTKCNFNLEIHETTQYRPKS